MRTRKTRKAKASVKVTCMTCEFSTLTKRMTNPVIAVCSKRKDIDQVSFTMQPVRELARIDRECRLYKKANCEKEIKCTED